MTDIATMVGELAAKRALIKDLRSEEKELEFQLISHLRQRYPEEWSRWERGIASFKAEGIEIPLKREYDVNKFRAAFGEEMPQAIDEEHEVTEVVPAKVNGRKVAGMWRDAALAKRLEATIMPQIPRVRLG